MAFAAERYSRANVLVNNAGIGPISRFDALRVEDWDAMIDVNIKGVLYGIAATLPLFAQQESGHIINLVSTAGLRIVCGSCPPWVFMRPRRTQSARSLRLCAKKQARTCVLPRFLLG